MRKALTSPVNPTDQNDKIKLSEVIFYDFLCMHHRGRVPMVRTCIKLSRIDLDPDFAKEAVVIQCLGM